MDNIIKTRIPQSEYRNVLMGFGYEKYKIISIQAIYKSSDFLLTLEKKE